MKNIARQVLLVLTCLLLPTMLFAQHSLSLDETSARRALIRGNLAWTPNTITDFMMPPTGGTLIVAPPFGVPALVWLTGGNTLAPGQVFGSVSNDDVVMVANNATRMTLLAAGGVSFASGAMNINAVPYVWPNVQGGPSTVIKNDGAGNLSWQVDEQVLYWDEAENTAAPNATIPVTSWTPNNVAANVDAAILPKGTGAFLVDVPDNLTAGGNKRGLNAVDLQVLRSNNTQVASGDYSVIGGGASNRAAGQLSTVAGGNANATTGDFAFVGAGFLNIVGGYRSAVVGGQTNTASGNLAIVGGGQDNAASGTYSTVSGGESNIVQGIHGTISGGNDNEIGSTAFAASVGGGSSNRVNGAYSTVPGGRSLVLDVNADRTFGFHSNNAAGTLPMTIDVPDIAVFGNADLWLANNDNSPSNLVFFEAYNTAGAFPNTAHRINIASPAVIGADYTLTLPVDDGTVGQLLTTDGAGVLSWGAVNLTSQVTGILPLANGGTNANLTATNGGVVWSNATQMQITPAGSAGQVLHSNGGGAPTWSAVVTADIQDDAVTFVKMQEITARSVIANGTNATANPTALQGTADQVLRVNGAGNALAFGQVATGGITDDAVTLGKIQNAAANSVLVGSGAAGSGSNYTEITLGTGLTMTGTVLSNSGATSITGTANQVLANGTSGVAQTGAVTLTTPQNIHSGATPTFAGMTLNGTLDMTDDDINNTGNIIMNGNVSITNSSLNVRINDDLEIIANNDLLFDGATANISNAGGDVRVNDNFVVTGSTTLNTGLTGVVKASSGVISASAVNLTSEVTGILQIANGGTNSGTALSGNTIMVSNGTQIVQGATGTANQVLHGNLTWGGVAAADITPGAVNQFLVTTAGPTTTWAGLNINSSLTGNGVATPLGLNLTNTNSWSVVQNFTNITNTGTATFTRTTTANAGPYAANSVSITSNNGGTIGNTDVIGLQVTATEGAGEDDRAIGGNFTATANGTGSAIAGRFSASGAGAGNNLAVEVVTGDLRIQPLTASQPVRLDASKNLVNGGINLAGGATEVTGILPIANGGTGANTANDALNNLLPSQAGNANEVLTTDGTNTSWATANSLVTGAALTKTDDANVTLTLGGTPTTALLQATSLTLGWTGQLSVARGGTGVDASTVADGQLLIGNDGADGFSLATLTAGTAIGISNGAGTITINNTGVTSLAGTANQVNVSAATGAITLSTPQDIHTGATPTFAGMTLNGTLDMTDDDINNAGNIIMNGNVSITNSSLNVRINDDLEIIANNDLLFDGATANISNAGGDVMVNDNFQVTGAGTSTTIQSATINIPNAGTPGVGKVLTSDGSGAATWQNPAQTQVWGTDDETLAAGQTDDLSIVADGVTLYRLDPSSGDAEISGIVAGATGRVIVLVNVNTTNDVVLLHEDAGSAAANRIRIAGGGSIHIETDGVVTLVYDGTTARWRIVSIQ